MFPVLFYYILTECYCRGLYFQCTSSCKYVFTGIRIADRPVKLQLSDNPHLSANSTIYHMREGKPSIHHQHLAAYCSSNTKVTTNS